MSKIKALMRARSLNLNKKSIILLPLFSTYLLFGDGGASVPCGTTAEYKAQQATFTAQQFTLVQYSVDGVDIPLSSSKTVRYRNNTHWVSLCEISQFTSCKSTVDEDNESITGFQIVNAQRTIYLDFVLDK